MEKNGLKKSKPSINNFHTLKYCILHRKVKSFGCTVHNDFRSENDAYLHSMQWKTLYLIKVLFTFYASYASVVIASEGQNTVYKE